jgi:hypothetical protein
MQFEKKGWENRRSDNHPTRALIEIPTASASYSMHSLFSEQQVIYFQLTTVFQLAARSPNWKLVINQIE